MLVPSPVDGTTGTMHFEPDDWSAAMVIRQADDGVHAIIADAHRDLRLWLPQPLLDGTPLAAVIVLDDDTPLRAEAMLRFWRHLRDGTDGIGPVLPVRQRQRLTLSLRALDGRLGGASYRAIATTLFGAVRVAAESWKTASIRDRTIRLVRGGIRLMRRGYRALLRGRPRP